MYDKSQQWSDEYLFLFYFNTLQNANDVLHAQNKIENVSKKFRRIDAFCDAPPSWFDC